MRVVKEIAHPHCKVTIFSWNNRYIIKLEQGTLEQTFKVDQYDIGDEEELIKLIDEEFLERALNRFLEMGQSLHEARERA